MNDPPVGVSPTLTFDGSGLAVVTFDDPDRSVNLLTEATLLRLVEVVREIRGEIGTGKVRGVLFRSARPGSFIAGADIDAIAAVTDPEAGVAAARFGQEALREIEFLPVPTLAAIHGVCLGGGLELALACGFRVVSDAPSTRLGLPEVLLGILPAWGGTTRLPRLIGLRASLDPLLTGGTVSAERALALGIADELLPQAAFFDSSLRLLESLTRGLGPPRRRRTLLSRALQGSPIGRRVLLRAARRSVVRKTGGHYPAPLRILEVLRHSLGRPIEEALAHEAAAAGELVASQVSKHLVHVFRLREAARKGGPPPGGEEVKRVGVVGAGIMGGGIAQLAASHEVPVRLRDLRAEAVSRALRHARGLFDRSVARDRFSRGEADRRMRLISGGVEAPGFGSLDLVVEAVVERMDVKQSVLQTLEGEVREDCILATNTSSLSVDRMAEALQRPERFLGLHFFNPVHRMPLVEIVQGGETDSAIVGRAYRFAVRLGKVPVVVRDGPGFLVNRVLGPYLNEAGFLLEEGAAVEDVDAVAKEFGMPMGPLRLIDEIGVEVVRHAGEVLFEGLGDRLSPSPALLALGHSGRQGRYGEGGVYRYRKGRETGVDADLYEDLGLDPPQRGSGPPAESIRDRLLLSLINEAARVLEDGIVESAAEVDLAMVMGTGFPPFRGGLLHLADQHHPRVILDRLTSHVNEGRRRFEPAPILTRLAREDRGFYDAFPRSV